MNKKKLLALLMALVMTFSLIPTTVWADDMPSEQPASAEEQLRTAIAAGDTVTLSEDITLTDSIDVGGTVTLDLKGHTISHSENYEKDYLIGVRRGGNLTVTDTSEGQGGAINATAENVYCGIKVTLAGENDSSNPATLTVDGGSITGYYYGISGNGTRHNTAITVTDGTITGTNGAGIYHPQEGTLTISGGTMTGLDAGIEVRSGTLSVTGGTFETKTATFSCDANGNGSTTKGAAIAIAQHTTLKRIDANISGATFIVPEGGTAVAVSVQNPQNNTFENVSVSANIVDSVKIPEGYVWHETANGVYALLNDQGVEVEDAVARIGNIPYATLADAIAAANDGDTVTLLTDVALTTHQQIAKTLILDLNGHKVSRTKDTNTTPVLYITAGTVTITGNGTVEKTGNGSMAVVVINEANLTIENGTITAPSWTIYNGGTGDLTISGGTVETTTGGDGAIENSSSGNVYVSGTATISAANNQAIRNDSDGEITISGGTVRATNQAIRNVADGKINISGGTVTATNNHGIYNAGNGKITISGGSISAFNYTVNNQNGGEITIGGGEVRANNFAAVYNKSTATVNISGGTITSSGGKAVLNNNNGTVNISGGTIQAGEDAVYNGDYWGQEGDPPTTGVINITGGTLSATNQRAVNNKTGTVNISGGTIEAPYNAVHNEATLNITENADNSKSPEITADSVGAVSNSGVLSISGGSLSSQFQTVCGSGTVTVTGGTITATDGNDAINSTSQSVNAVLIENGTIRAENGRSVYGNQITVNGGTIFAGDGVAIYTPSDSNQKVKISGGTITSQNNYAVEAETIEISGGTLVGKTAIYIKGTSGSLTVTGEPTIQATGAGAYDYAICANPFTSFSIAGNGWFDGKIYTPTVNQGTYTITGGHFSNDPSAYVDLDQYAVVEYNDDTHTDWFEVNGNPAAKNTTTNRSYATLAAAIAAANPGETINLLQDIALTETVDITKNLTIDLNQHNITAADARALWVKSGEVTITGSGTISSTHTEGNTTFKSGSSVIRVGDSGSEKAKLTIDSDVTVVAPYTYGVTVFGTNTNGVELEVNGTVHSSGSEAAISGNGNTGNRGTVTINAGAIVTADNAEAIYHPQGDSLTINGGTITGKTGIYQKSGTMTVNGGNITGNGDKANYNPTGDDCVPTGDAIVIDNCGYPGGEPNANIKGATLASDNGKQVGYYVYNNSPEGTVLADKAYTLSTNVPAKGWVDTIGDNAVDYPKTIGTPTAVAKVGDVAYGTLAAAIAAANVNGGTVTLLRDYDMEANEPGYGYTTSYVSAGETTPRNNMIEIRDGVTFDLGTHTLNNLFNNTFNVTGDNVTIKNGTMNLGQLYYGSYSAKNGVTPYAEPTCGSYVMYVTGAQNFVIEDLTTFGGINVSGATATINNLSFSGTTFYAVCSQSGASVTLNGGTYNKAINGAANYLFWVQSGSTMNITGGNYVKGTAKFILDSGINPVITGGTFDFNPTNNGVADGYEAVDNGNGTWTVQAKAVAQIGSTQYPTLQAAFNAAQSGDTVQLLTDIDSSSWFDVNGNETEPVQKSISLDLNGHNISSSGLWQAGGSLNVTGEGTITSTNPGAAPISIYFKQDKTAKRTLTIGPNVTLAGTEYGINIFGSNDATVNTIDVNINGTVKGTVFVLGNLTNDSNAIMVNVNGTVDTTDLGVDSDGYLPNGIALNGYANVTVNSGAVVMGGTAVEVRAGNLTINGGTFTALQGAYNNNANGSGVASHGAAVAVMQHTTAKKIVARINGGTFEGPCALGIANPQANTDKNVTVIVTGGIFKGDVDQTVKNDDNRVTGFISGGTYYDDSVKNEDYIASGYEAVRITASNRASAGFDGNNAYDGWYQVGKISSGTITKAAEQSTANAVTYTAPRTVVNEDNNGAALQTGSTVTVNVKAPVTAAAASGVENIATNNALALYTENQLSAVVSAAMPEVAEDADAIDVEIVIVKDSGTQVENNNKVTKVTYDVHPEAIVYRDNAKIGSVNLEEVELNPDKSYTIQLPTAGFEVGAKVRVTHIHANGDAEVIKTFTVDNSGFIVIEGITSFSDFELAYVDTTAEDVSVSTGMTLSLNESIDVNMYMYNLTSGTTVDKFTVSSWVNDRQVLNNVALSESNRHSSTIKNTVAYKLVVADCAAKEVGDTIRVQIKYDGTLVKEITYSVKQYCENACKSASNSTALQNLCRAVLDYGTAAQYNFSYNVSNPANENYSNWATAMTYDIPSDKNVKASSVSGTNPFSATGMTLSLESKVEINFYFRPNGNISDYTFTVQRGNYAPESVDISKLTTNSGYYVLTVDGIAAVDLDEEVIVTGSYGDNSKTITYSPLSYAYANQNVSGYETLGDVLRAMYYYNQMAENYFNSIQH